MNDQLCVYKTEILNLANNQVQQAISNALNSLLSTSLIFQNPTISIPNRSLRPIVRLRYRSSSNSRNDRKVPFHNTIPRCSLPATENDLVHYQSHLLSNQTRCQASQNTNESNRTFDVQYSFSLNKSPLIKINKKQHSLINIQNFANELIEHSIQTALIQIHENETSCLPFDCCLERYQAINPYIDRFIHSTIEQAIETIFSSAIKRLLNHLTEDIITDALSIIADDEIYSKSLLINNKIYVRKIKKKSIQLENTKQPQTILFNQIPDHSTNEESVDTLVNNIAQQIYMDSFDELRQIFTDDNNSN